MMTLPSRGALFIACQSVIMRPEKFSILVNFNRRSAAFAPIVRLELSGICDEPYVNWLTQTQKAPAASRG
jgi:hypothetical protein